MPLKTITKNFAFVIFLTALGAVLTGCASVFPNHAETPPGDAVNGGFDEPKVIARFESSEIRESSGIAVSKCQDGVFWTHNDSGDEAFLYAFDAKGRKLGTWKVVGAKNYDWEDISTLKSPDGKCVLYIGDIGNNTRIRDELTIYVVAEPNVSASAESSRKKPLTTDAAKTVRFVYPDMRRDAETLMVNPQNGDIYVVSKRLSGSAGVYKLKSGYSFDATNTLEFVSDLSVPAIPNGFLTGGDIAPDGRHVVVCDYFGAYEFVLPPDVRNFDDIWKQETRPIALGTREQGEAIAYSTDGDALFATSEKKNSPLIKVVRKQN